MIVTLALFAGASAAEPSPRSPPPPSPPAYVELDSAACRLSPLQVTQGAPSTGPRKMTELPPGQVVLAVEKRVGGCAVNVLKRKDLAGNHVMVPAGPAAVRKAPAASPSKAQGLPQRER